MPWVWRAVCIVTTRPRSADAEVFLEHRSRVPTTVNRGEAQMQTGEFAAGSPPWSQPGSNRRPPACKGPAVTLPRIRCRFTPQILACAQAVDHSKARSQRQRLPSGFDAIGPIWCWSIAARADPTGQRTGPMPGRRVSCRVEQLRRRRDRSGGTRFERLPRPGRLHTPTALPVAIARCNGREGAQ